ncbi:cupin domain-containing protein [Spongiactinospora sp. TRM90649]|uniref:cupin domain-containing protein n=1 Tax=Spongiactinospora sp. TRM90649 TaxID=3031114 RepID=UPI0023F82DE2|nr:cupin domain-containing protein [Spongiactinospora sp. TRM90649]MDF5752354.1 cupin domain-containing protein [Spongiactinospora sp. TRM90649]
MLLKVYPDGRPVHARDDSEALRIAAEAFPGPEPVVAVDDGRMRFLRRDAAGTFISIEERPPVAEALGLLPHPEGGWFRETWRTEASFRPEGYPGERSSATGIYFLLMPGEESIWHAVRSDEVWLWHRGGPLALLIDDREPIILGPEVERGQIPQAIVPAGAWQAARPAGDREVLVSCVVSPGFDFADFRTR